MDAYNESHVIYDTFQVIEASDRLIYSMLKELKPDLCVDVGASNGQTTLYMLNNHPSARIVAIEPWPANIGLFKKNLDGRLNVTLHEAACTTEAGRVKFYCSTEVSSAYSSLGYIVKEGMKRDPVRQIEVDAVRLDSIVNERIGFLKIDVQGGEYEVLCGADKIIRGPGIDIILVEYNNDARLLNLLADLDYVIFDLEYLLYFENEDFLNNHMQKPRAAHLTTGAKAWSGFLKGGVPRDFVGWSNFIASQRGVQTDLLAIQRKYLSRAMLAFELTSGKKV